VSAKESSRGSALGGAESRRVSRGRVGGSAKAGESRRRGSFARRLGAPLGAGLSETILTLEDSPFLGELLPQVRDLGVGRAWNAYSGEPGNNVLGILQFAHRIRARLFLNRIPASTPVILSNRYRRRWLRKRPIMIRAINRNVARSRPILGEGLWLRVAILDHYSGGSG